MKNKKRLMCALLAFGFLMTGCAHQRPLAYHDDSQIPQGPGLLSGKDGAFKLQFNDLERDGASNSISNQTDPKNNGERL